MQICSFIAGDGVSYGIADGNGIREAGSGLRSRYATLREVLAAGALPELHDAVGGMSKIDPAGITMLPPIPRPDKIMCVGLNYKSHIRETGREDPKYPSVFNRYPDSLVGNGAPLLRPKVSEKFDFEGELAVVIGKPARHVSAEKALDHVAGYSCFNDGSVRDFQRHTSQFFAGKSFEHSGSMGPWLVTPDEVGDLDALQLETRLNGQTMQAASLGDLMFRVPQIIEYLSKIITLLPGDVIATGTPSGVGLFRDPPLWMKAGDVVEVEITGLGVLRNIVEDEA